MREGDRKESRVGGLAREERWVAAAVPSQGSFFYPPKVLPLYCFVPLGIPEIKFIGWVQGINFSGRWKHLEQEGDGGSRERVGGTEREEGETKNNSIRQGTGNSNNFSGQCQLICLSRGKLRAPCAGHTGVCIGLFL